MDLVELIQGGPFRILALSVEKATRILPDKTYLKMMYKIRLGKKLNLDNPKTWNEKLQWIKLNDRKEIYTAMADKYKVKKIVGDLIGEEYVIPTLGVWDSFNEINFDELPNAFVLKCTHDSGSIVICRDKNQFDREVAKKKLSKALKRNYYWSSREWPYKNIERRIIAEPYIESLANHSSKEYKITCHNGKMAFGTICSGIAHSVLNDRKNDFYDENFNIMPFYIFYKPSDNPATVKPEFYDKMVELAEKIAQGTLHLRVDFYYCDGRIYFGEATFFSWGGFNKFEPAEWDEILGAKLKLSAKN